MDKAALKQKIQAFAQQLAPELSVIRRHLHAHPELSFQEHETSEYIAQHLADWDIAHTTGIVETGIVGTVGSLAGKIVGLRADIDALPILEKNEVDYASKHEGKMHACGHDVHTTCLLGALKILKSLESELSGGVKFVFQPGEEKLPGGASLVLASGAMDNPSPDQMYGQHVFPELEVGKVGFRPGMYMASCDEIYVTVKGKGGHAAMPHKNIDPVLISAHLIVALQQVVSRMAQPDIPTVLSFGDIHGQGATNVIPDEVKLEGTFRTFNEKWRAEAHEKMVALATSLAESMGGTVEFRIEKGYPFLENDPKTTAKAQEAASAYLGAANVVDLPTRMTAEDFSYYSHRYPSCFYRLGTASADGTHAIGVHNSHFDIDEKALVIGAGLMAYLVVEGLEDVDEG